MAASFHPFHGTVNVIISHLVILLALLIRGSAAYDNDLSPYFYEHSCPHALSIVKSVVKKAVEKEARMAASLLRLHFHDCFVHGCDASVLLDDTPSFRGEKTANPNKNSLRGFDVVDDIKSQLESACPGIVSCADIVAIAARDSVALRGGPEWSVPLGRRDSRWASFSGANQNIPAPNSTLQTLTTKFELQGLNEEDLVALSGGHTIGQARCISFRQRVYGRSGNQKPDLAIDESYSTQLKSSCPRSGGDNNLSPLDVVSPTKFDNQYFKNVENLKGLLVTDAELYSNHMNPEMAKIVSVYAANKDLFFKQFAESMVKMSSIKLLTGSKGEIRHNCRRMN